MSTCAKEKDLTDGRTEHLGEEVKKKKTVIEIHPHPKTKEDNPKQNVTTQTFIDKGPKKI